MNTTETAPQKRKNPYRPNLLALLAELGFSRDPAPSSLRISKVFQHSAGP
jgi:hypothetical protein